MTFEAFDKFTLSDMPLDAIKGTGPFSLFELGKEVPYFIFKEET